MRNLGRVLVPICTPFKSDGSVDYERAGELAQRTIDLGYGDSIIVSGTTGEFSALLTEERIELFKVVKDAVGDNTPVIAGTGHSCLEEAIRLTRAAQRIGVDVAMVVGPYYSRPTQEGIYEYYKAIAKSVDLPIMLYNIPLFTGVNIEPPTLRRLAEIENIIGIKEEAGINPIQTTEYILNTRPDFLVYDGDDTMILPIMIQGGVGVVSGGAQVIGDRIKKMIDLFLGNRREEATRLHQEIFPLFRAFGQRVNPVPLIKAALEIVGFEVGPPRIPLLPATDKEREVIQKALVGMGVIGA